MKKPIRVILSLTFLIPALVSAAPPEIHCKHFFYGYPLGTPETNDLIIRDIYALSSNDDRKFADWVAYRFDVDTVEGDAPMYRIWESDPWLDKDERLETRPDDYDGAYDAFGYERGYQAPQASFKGVFDRWETMYYSNVTPRKSDLNQGPWKRLEERVRDLAANSVIYISGRDILYGCVYVMTGPLYENPMPQLPGADEPHTVPSGFWKIVAIQPEFGYAAISVAGFIFDQDAPADADVLDHLVTVDEIEERSGLDFMRELPDDVEDEIERAKDKKWAAEWVK
ncbi:MAG: DNA/RNA non-specific endonuclease [Candidatus Coatesbacteria bacterium]|nr:MAG: DNA/RNA non-specific endonuclease [Candidatus Coatesbacteria bacterium]